MKNVIVSAATKLTAKFDVPYQAGELCTIGLVNGKAVAKTTLKTAGPAKELKLTAARKSIRSDRNDLCDRRGGGCRRTTYSKCQDSRALLDQRTGGTGGSG